MKRRIKLFFVSILCVSLLIAETAFAAPKEMAGGVVFDPTFYAENNADVVAALGNDENMLFTHYVNSGASEGRLPFRQGILTNAPISASNGVYTLSTNITTCNLAPGESVVFTFSLVTSSTSTFNLYWSVPSYANSFNMQWGPWYYEGNIAKSDLTVTGLAAGSTVMSVFVQQSPDVIINIPISVSGNGVVNNSIPVSTDLAYLGRADFQRIKREYHEAVPECAYVLPYTGSDGKSYAMVYVSYHIITRWNLTTLHNLTDGTYIENPDKYYQTRVNRTFGAGKIANYNMQSEVLTWKKACLEGLSNYLQTGVSNDGGVYVGPDLMDP